MCGRCQGLRGAERFIVVAVAVEMGWPPLEFERSRVVVASAVSGFPPFDGQDGGRSGFLGRWFWFRIANRARWLFDGQAQNPRIVVVACARASASRRRLLVSHPVCVATEGAAGWLRLAQQSYR